MKIKKLIASGVTALLLGAGIAVGPVLTASAHTPSISASCSGVVLKATAYGSKATNKYSVTIGGKTSIGTFGASLNKTFPVPNNGETTSWSALISDENGGYSEHKSGVVGPCGPATITLPTLGTSPATCTSAGSFNPNFLSWPAAQNPNGYEGDGFRVYLNKPFTGAGTYVATLQKVGAGFDPRYPNGTKVVGATSQTLVVAPQISDEICAGDQPEAKVIYTEWGDEATSCAVDKVTQSRTKTTTPFVRVGQKWVEDTANVKVETETQLRDKTVDEIKPCVEIPDSIFTQSSSEIVNCESENVVKTTLHFQSDAVWNATSASYDSYTEPRLIKTTSENRTATVDELDEFDCPVEDQPEAKVTHTEWVDGKIVCGDTAVEQTRNSSTTPYVLVDREWVAGKTTVETLTQTRELSKEELANNVCPAVIKDVPTKTVGAASLPVTGSSDSIPLIGGASLLLLLGSAAAFYARKRGLADLS